MLQSEKGASGDSPRRETDEEGESVVLRCTAHEPDHVRLIGEGCYETYPTNHEFR